MKQKNVAMITRKTAKIKTTIQMVFLYLGLCVGLFQNVNFLQDYGWNGFLIQISFSTL